MSEQDIQRKILLYLESVGAYAVKIITSNKRGTPDILACHKGKFYAIEVKTPQGLLSPLQAVHLTRAKEAGAIALVARSINDIKEILQ